MREFERKILDVAAGAGEADLATLCDRLEALYPMPAAGVSSPVPHAILTPRPLPRRQGDRAAFRGCAQA